MKVKRKGKKIISKQSKHRKKQFKKSFKKSQGATAADDRRKKNKKAVLGIKRKDFSNYLRKMAQQSTTEENIIKLVKKLLGDETIDALPGYDDEINLLQDLDLLVLGSSPEEYNRYRELLRKEYSHLDDDSYKKMRLKQDQPEPSTSGTSTLKDPLEGVHVRKKSFIKFKDTKHREELIEKYKLNSKKRFPVGLNGISSPSLSQATSKKIIHQIKKRNNKPYIKSPSKSSKMPDETRQKLFIGKETASAASVSAEDIDDDCICIETKPEVILIDDESTAPISVVKELELKYLKFKQYEPIGSIRMNQRHDHLNNNNNKLLTSTPTQNRVNGSSNTSSRVASFNQDKDSSFGALSSSAICYNSDDVTIVEDVQYTPNDVIVIDDTIVPRRKNSRRESKRNRSCNDNSVIFVSEESAPGTPKGPAVAFIPLDTPAEEVKIRLAPICNSPPRPKRKCTQRTNNDLLTSREEKQLQQYNGNAYNPNKAADKEKQEKKRMVIVDGSNVAYQHALNKEFSVKGLKICLDYFTKIGHEVKAVVPQYRLQKQRSSNPEELETLHREGKIVFTPCKNLPGKSSTSYDDRFILQLASELDAAVVSNDNYRDLLNENSALKKIIENRVIGYTWCNDVFILPKDPYGKWGPTLDAILNRS